MSLTGEAGGSRRRWLFVVAVLVALAIGGVSWLVLRRPAVGTSPVPSTGPRPRATSRATPLPAPAGGAAAGELHVESSVSGATVWVDDHRLGAAPQHSELPAGPHRLRVAKDGFEPYEVEVQVVPGHTARVIARLEREPPLLRVDADVPGARVFLDRRFVGTTPVETREVAPGPHRVDVSAEGYDIHGETVELAPGRNEVVVRFKEVHLDETLPVTHRHAVGSCRGTLTASTSGLRYQTANTADAFSVPLAGLAPLEVDYLGRNLKVKAKGRTYNFTADSADALLTFQRAVEAARKKLMIAR